MSMDEEIIVEQVKGPLKKEGVGEVDILIEYFKHVEKLDISHMRGYKTEIKAKLTRDEPRIKVEVKINRNPLFRGRADEVRIDGTFLQPEANLHHFGISNTVSPGTIYFAYIGYVEVYVDILNDIHITAREKQQTS